LFQARSWGLIIYDEVHLLPALPPPAELQARRRLGLTATLIREDGRDDVSVQTLRCALAELEGQGFIATASCTEMRVPQDEERQMGMPTQRRQQFRSS